MSWSQPQPRQRPEPHRERPTNPPHDRKEPDIVPNPTPGPARPDPRYRQPRRVVHVIDRWRYDGRWWEAHELHRDYYFLELDGGARLELFREGEDWWAARLTD